MLLSTVIALPYGYPIIIRPGGYLGTVMLPPEAASEKEDVAPPQKPIIEIPKASGPNKAEISESTKKFADDLALQERLNRAKENSESN